MAHDRLDHLLVAGPSLSLKDRRFRRHLRARGQPDFGYFADDPKVPDSSQ